METFASCIAALLMAVARRLSKIVRSVQITTNAHLRNVQPRDFSVVIDSKMYVTSITSRRVVCPPLARIRPRNIRRIAVCIHVVTKAVQQKHDQRNDGLTVMSIDVAVKDARHCLISAR